MACYTMVEIVVEDNALNRQARKNLGLREEGSVSERDARRIKVEASVLKSIKEARRLSPTAVIRRKGNEITVTVQSGG